MRVKRTVGQSLVEFALVVPMLFLLMACVIEFGWTYYQLYYLNGLARMAARALATQSTANNAVATTIIQSYGGAVNSAAATVAVTNVVVSGNSVTLGTAAAATNRTAGNLLTVYYSYQYWPFTRLVDLRNFGGPTYLRARYSFVIQQ